MIGKAVAVLAACVLLAGCGQSPSVAPAGSSPGGSAAAEASEAAVPKLSGTVNVFAAASLKKAFTELGDELTSQHPGVKIEFVFGGSSDLVSQLTAGAPSDIFASADEANMTKATDAGLVDGLPTPFATNHLTIAVAPGNPLGIASLADLANAGLKVVVCAPQVPCGAATQQVAGLAGVTLSPVSEENAVSGVLAKVTTGEADAGLVYRTDVRAAGEKATAVDFPEADQVTNVYPIALLTDAQNTRASRAFIDLVLSARGRQVMRDAGFNLPQG